MRKRILTLFIAVAMVSVTLTGCGETTEIIDNKKPATVSGSYHIFRTQNSDDYLNFLETFDENKYEIIDISTSMPTYHMSEFYIITYKDNDAATDK